MRFNEFELTIKTTYLAEIWGIAKMTKERYKILSIRRPRWMTQADFLDVIEGLKLYVPKEKDFTDSHE